MQSCVADICGLQWLAAGSRKQQTEAATCTRMQQTKRSAKQRYYEGRIDTHCVEHDCALPGGR